MQLFSRLFPGFALGSILLLTGCVMPGYPYPGPYGYPPYGAVAPPPVSGAMVQSASQSYPEVSATGVVVAGPGYPYVYAPAPALIAPTPFVGWGNGYWYGNRFWPYRSGCAFYGGRYYGGYGASYWRRGYGSWHGANAHGVYYGSRNGYDGNWNR